MKKISIILLMFLMMILVGCSEKPEEDEYAWVKNIKYTASINWTSTETPRFGLRLASVNFYSFEITDVKISNAGGYNIDFIYEYKIASPSDYHTVIAFITRKENNEREVTYTTLGSEWGKVIIQEDSIYVPHKVLEIIFF